jgi:hypothetical protein
MFSKSFSLEFECSTFHMGDLSSYFKKEQRTSGVDDIEVKSLIFYISPSDKWAKDSEKYHQVLCILEFDVVQVRGASSRHGCLAVKFRIIRFYSFQNLHIEMVPSSFVSVQCHKLSSYRT